MEEFLQQVVSGLASGGIFASLALSSHPGTAGMGVMLMTGMATTLLSIFTFMPALLGPPPSQR